MPRRWEPQPAFGKAVRIARLRQQMTQKALATAADLDVAWVSSLERGSRSNPALGTMQRIADALGMRLSELVRLAEGVRDGEVELPDLDRRVRGERP